jgi:hypothetical protein
MWRIDPSFLCNTHLVAEHREMHMLAGSLRRAHRLLDSQIAQGLFEPYRTRERHDALAAEMTARGMRHRSPLQEVAVGRPLAPGYVCEVVSVRELLRRCEWCRHRAKQLGEYRFTPDGHTCSEQCADRSRRDAEARPAAGSGIAAERIARASTLSRRTPATRRRRSSLDT